MLDPSKIHWVSSSWQKLFSTFMHMKKRGILFRSTTGDQDPLTRDQLSMLGKGEVSPRWRNPVFSVDHTAIFSPVCQPPCGWLYLLLYNVFCRCKLYFPHFDRLHLLMTLCIGYYSQRRNSLFLFFHISSFGISSRFVKFSRQTILSRCLRENGRFLRMRDPQRFR